MPAVAFSSADVLVTAANIMYAPLGTALPDETTVAWNDMANWPTGWIHVGYTSTPAQISYTYETFELSVEQSTAPIIQRKTNEVATINVSLSQFDGPNLALLTDGTVTLVAAGASQKGFTTVKTGGATSLKEYMFALEGLRPASNGSSQPVRMFFYRASIRVNGNIEFAKGAGTALPATISALLDSSKAVGSQLFEAHIVTAVATS